MFTKYHHALKKNIPVEKLNKDIMFVFTSPKKYDCKKVDSIEKPYQPTRVIPAVTGYNSGPLSL